MKQFVRPIGSALLLSVLGACRPSIAPVEAPTSMTPEPGPGVQACWVESKGLLGFTASAVLVRHPDGGDILIDAGNSSNFDEEIEPYEGSTKRWLATYPRALKPTQPLDSLLVALGVDPAGLKAVLATHAHLDHVGGALDLPGIPLWVDAADAELIERGRHEVTFEVMPAHAKALAPRTERLSFEDIPYEIFERHADLFGDGSVVVVPLHGHTPGSVGVFVRLSDGRRIFHVGDAVNNRKQISRLKGRSAAMRRTDSDPNAANQIVGRLRHLQQQRPDLLFIPAHERAAWKAAFQTPANTCP